MNDFFVVEGVDGSGKTTLCNELFSWLNEMNVPVEFVYNPQHTELGQEIKKRIVDGCVHSVEVWMSLFLASHWELLQKKILPALAEGKVVFCDGYINSTLAYQYLPAWNNKNRSGFLREMKEILYLLPKPKGEIILEMSCEMQAKRVELRRDAGLFDKNADLQRVAAQWYRQFTNREHTIKRISAELPKEQVFVEAKGFIAHNVSEVHLLKLINRRHQRERGGEHDS